MSKNVSVFCLYLLLMFLFQNEGQEAVTVGIGLDLNFTEWIRTLIFAVCCSVERSTCVSSSGCSHSLSAR